ncbi:glycosyltransferase family 2 protein [Neobacillus muris]|uniref:glycosyltransferase family 2 protein n=1 Tax=Neobacillus muris TaxID=2941334 RepID=UPI00203ADD38|nr:glycosyltransferase family 2 protein [Neobacillus muris]
MEPYKISIVVPIYKVEKYLSRCIESIISQTYTNLEIVLVNDGSPDRCQEIAKEYEKIDDRIKVFHKSNGGLSDARNFGVQHVTGDYTLFVDSDDWLEKHMIAELVENSLKFKADIVQTAFYYAYVDYLLFDNRYFQQDDPPVVLNNKELMAELVINERVKNFAWGKLYKTNIVKDIPFKIGVLYEDVFWAHKVMQRVGTYVMLHQPLYYYFQRGDSIVSSYTAKNLDIIKGLKERQCFIEEYYRELTDESYKVLLKTMFIHYNLLLISKQKDHRGVLRKELRNDIRKNYIKYKKAVKNDRHLRKQLMLFSIHPYLNVAYLALQKAMRKIAVNTKSFELEKINL